MSEAAGTTYLDRLAARSAATGTVLCLGLDPVPTALPKGFSPDIAGVNTRGFADVRMCDCRPDCSARP